MPLTPGEKRHVKDWPVDLVKIAEVVGIECAEMIARNFGGHHVRIATSFEPSSKLPSLIGEERYAALAEHFTQGIGDVHLEIPTGPFLAVKQEQRFRDGLFWEALDTCNTVTEVARHVGVTNRTVRRRMRKLGMTAADLRLNTKENDQ